MSGKMEREINHYYIQWIKNLTSASASVSTLGTSWSSCKDCSDGGELHRRMQYESINVVHSHWNAMLGIRCH